MENIDKTVFLSFRRSNAPCALGIFQNLTQHGYDVFFDFQGIAGGEFEHVIFENIDARGHFIVLLTPSALERCADPEDQLRKEIERALDTKRNIVPVLLEGFDFATPAIAGRLTGALEPLMQYKPLRIPDDYFSEAMERLRTQYLNVPLDTVPRPDSLTAHAALFQHAAAAAHLVTNEELTAQIYSERGFEAKDAGEKLRFYTQAFRLQPNGADLFVARGHERSAKGDLGGALGDYTEAIRLQPNNPDLFVIRGNARISQNELDGALQDYTEAIRLKPDNANAFNNRGNVRRAKGDLDGALEDFSEAIRLNPGYANAYYNRGIARRAKNDLDGALEDYTDSIRLNPGNAEAFINRGNIRYAKHDFDGAIEDYSEALRLQPDNAHALANRAITRKAKGDLDGARADLDESTRLTAFV